MNDIPKSVVGKVLRINFSNRLNIPTIIDSKETIKSQLLYEAQCPLKGASISEPISSHTVEWSIEDVIKTVKTHPQVKDCTAYHILDGHKFILFVVNNNRNDPQDDILANDIQKYLQLQIHDYMLPTDILIVEQLHFNDDGKIDIQHLENLARQHQKNTDDPITMVLCDIFALAIGMPKVSHCNDTRFPADGDFFDYGGNSLKMGFIISLIRSKLGVTLPVSILYEECCRTPIGLATKCHEKISQDHPLLTQGYSAFQQNHNGDENGARYEKQKPSGAKNPFNPFIMMFQASPMYLIQPLFGIIRWILFAHMLILFSSLNWYESSNALLRLLQIILALITTGIVSGIVFPMVGIFVKWLVIGRYHAGRYPMWGQYYLRWWFVNKILMVTGIGAFRLHSKLYAFYLRLMGAKVGRNSSISYTANIQEYDLITIGSDCYIPKCTIRPFVLTRGHMNLMKIDIGDNCVVGLRTNVVAGSIVANGTILGPQTTTYARDMLAEGSSAQKDTIEGILLTDLCPEAFPNPHYILQCLIGWPLLLIAYAISHIPWCYCVYLVGKEVFFVGTSSEKIEFAHIILYFADPIRVGYCLLSKFVRHRIVPALYMSIVVFIKRFVIGKFKPGPRNHDQLSLMRYWLMKTALSMIEWKVLATMVGSHYEVISIIYRLLGAKVGKRVYWPGTGIKIVEFDLLTVGNDVTFGSRSHIICGDAMEYAPVTIDDGAMCADNCVLLPGSRIGRNAILGSGGLLKKHFNLSDGSIWYGSFNGNAVKLRDGVNMGKHVSNVNTGKEGEKLEHMTTSKTTIISMEDNNIEDETITPFGRAFYERKANYFVLPLELIISYNVFLMVIGTVLRALPILAALQVAAAYQRSDHDNEAILILILIGAKCFLNVLSNILALSLEIVTKWILFGRRRQGSYNWDRSSYCQRWQVLISVQMNVRENILYLLGGSSWIVLFFRALGCKIGKRVCLYPNGGDPVMTEPDLAVLEDDVMVDRASLVCHLNSFGEFSINPIRVGEGSILQNDSRLASGASMLRNCVLLDHSYIIPGEVADAHSVWQGYPAISTSIEE